MNSGESGVFLIVYKSTMLKLTNLRKSMKKLNSKGSSPLHIVLVLVIVGLIAGVGYYVYNSQKETKQNLDNANSSLNSASQSGDKKEETKEDEKDETAGWVSFKNEAGEFSVRHPKEWVTAEDTSTCSNESLSITLIGTKESVGDDCYGNQGQMSLGSNTDTSYDYLPIESGLSDYKKETVAVDGVEGYKVSGSLKVADTYYEQGAKMVTYSFKTNNRVYFFQYRQNAESPELMSDFTTMVTKTLTFN